MRALKITGIVLASLIALVIVAGVALTLLIDPNDYRGDIERLVQQKTGRTLQIGGKLDLRLFPWLALSIGDVRLGNPAGYGAEPFATVRQVSVGVRLLPLLHKRLQVSRVSIDGFTANLVSRSDTDNNWKDLGGNQSAPAQQPSGPAPEGSIEGLELTNASLSFRDEAKKSVTVLSSLEVKAGAVGTGAPVPISLAFDYASSSAAPGGNTGAKPPVHLSVSSPGVRLDPAAGTLAPAQFDIKAGDLALQLTATGEKLLTDRILTGKVSLPTVSLRKLLDTYGGGAPVTRDAKALAAFSLDCDYRLTRKQLRLTNVVLILDDTHMRGAAGVEDLDTLALSYDLKVDAINFDRYRAPAPPATSQGHPSASAPAPGGSKTKAPTPLPIEAIRKLNLQGTLQVGTATLSGIALTGLTLPVTASDGRLRVGPTQARVLGGSYNGDIVLDARGPQAHLSTNEHTKGIDLGALAKALFDTTRLSGHGDANIVVSGVGNTDADIMRSLGGKIDVVVRDGAVNGIDLWYEERRAYALIKQTAVPERTQPVRTAFNTLSATANLDKGVAHNDDLTIATDFLKLRGKGTVDLTTQAVDYQVVASLYKIPPAGSAGSELASLQSTDVPFTIRGSVDNLTVRPDIESLAKAKIRQEVNDQLEKHKDELQQKLGDKLKGLFGR